MTIKVLMPALSPTMTEGNLAKWHKKEGDTVKAGEVIAEIETDKATMEVEAVDEGKIGKILIPAGTQGVKVNEPIAILLEEGENDNALKDAGKAEAPKAAAAPAPAVAPSAPTSAPAPQAATPAKQTSAGSRVFATPLAKRLAREANLDLSKINGSGPKGRIVKADVLGGGHVGEQRVGLKHHARGALVRRQAGDVLVIEQHAPAGRRQKAGNHAQGRGLAAAGGTEQRDQFAFAHGKLEVVDGERGAEPLGELFNRQARHQTTLDKLTKRSVRTISAPTSRICAVATAESVGSMRNSR